MSEEQILEYINRQDSPQKEILVKLRELFFAVLKKPNEKKQFGVITYDKAKFYLAAIKDKVHIGFAITGLADEEIKLFAGSGKTMRHIKIFSIKDIAEKNVAELIKLVENKAQCAECKKK